MKLKKLKPKLNTYLFKATWQGTALRFKIEAKDEEEADRKAASYVKRMEGWKNCLKLELITLK